MCQGLGWDLGTRTKTQSQPVGSEARGRSKHRSAAGEGQWRQEGAPLGRGWPSRAQKHQQHLTCVQGPSHAARGAGEGDGRGISPTLWSLQRACNDSLQHWGGSRGWGLGVFLDLASIPPPALDSGVPADKRLTLGL